ncbi:Transcriptional regulator SoxR family protein [Lactobacillus gigeriorum DSM 23908 = CRBIP 24.85]|uniref:Transcriptional regulator SoxR family protein n=1 Tax=Lactobacillus gigeriorum DSM 23908 = CRBIP 24.85 TaxID=1423751 RepID=I7KPV0_9LACO|nr:hypothetical protein FC38_GL001149 [Lactobacillus gigeriorum DSM 23908 = CRBIP 24.85]CCI87534.1 Transcriptional regulator SoxR family protein [Lactobacillus gigeriorum DSM 23908 = CRBIP 24.85]
MADKALPQYLTISQAAQYLNTTPNTLRVWEREGKIKPSRTAGNQRRYTQEMLDATLGKKKACIKQSGQADYWLLPCFF